MPPLRLLRYLRPCHPPGSAHQARCASNTARIDFSTDGDDTANNSPGSHRNASQEAATQTAEPEDEQQIGHGAPIRKVALFDHQRKVADPARLSKPPAGTNITQANADNAAREDQGANKEKEKGRGQRQRDWARLGVNSARRESAFTIRKYVAGESQRPEHASHQSTQMPQQEGISEIRTQLQYLFQEVRKLQDAVGAKTPAEHLSISVRGRTTSQTPSSTAGTGLASQEVMPEGNTRPILNPNVPIVNQQQSPLTAPPGQTYAQRQTPPRSNLYRRAWLRYRKSIYQLVTIANALENMSSHVVSPIGSLITQHLRRVAQDAFATNDQGTIGNLGRYKWGINALVAGLDRPPAAHDPAARTSPKTVVPGAPIVEQQLDRTQASLPTNHFSRREQSRREPTRQSADRSKTAADEADIRTTGNEKRGRFNEDTPEEDLSARHEADERNDGQRLVQQIHSRSRSMSSSDHSKVGTVASMPPNSGTGTRSTYKSLRHEMDEPSLLDELFPESSGPGQPRSTKKRDQYPKLDPPAVQPIRQATVAKPKTLKEQVVESFQKGREQVTALQLAHCSTELTEADFRRVIPKGKHIESWRQDGGLFKIIPGRDPLSLERMPFYYILFKDYASALAYQKNASRLHKLSALHQPSSIFSAIPPPKGFLENGENLNAATSSYNLLPTHHNFTLSVVMQPYNPALRALLERGGYQPIVPDTDAAGKRIWKVLMHIDGYEPTPSDLFKIFRTDAFKQGLPVLPLRNESRTSLHRLRDIINLRTNTKLISSISPRAYGSFDQLSEAESHVEYEDPSIQFLLAGADEDTSPKALKQMVMNRVYNRWVIEFADEDSAIRFARRWNRRVLPDLFRDNTWSHAEDVRMCNLEVLW